jgi:hypothetical protein
MKILHLKGFTDAEVAGYKKLVHKNVLDNMRILIKGAETLDIPLDDPVRGRYPPSKTLARLTFILRRRRRRLYPLIS